MSSLVGWTLNRLTGSETTDLDWLPYCMRGQHLWSLCLTGEVIEFYTSLCDRDRDMEYFDLIERFEKHLILCNCPRRPLLDSLMLNNRQQNPFIIGPTGWSPKPLKLFGNNQKCTCGLRLFFTILTWLLRLGSWIDCSQYSPKSNGSRYRPSQVGYSHSQCN